MTNHSTMLLLGIFFVCGFTPPASSDEATLFPISDVKSEIGEIELWYGSKLDDSAFPAVEWLPEGSVQIGESLEELPAASAPIPIDSEQSSPQQEVVESSLQQVSFKGVADPPGEEFPSDFAEPIDVGVWGIVKWTCVVLFIAGFTTYAIKVKQGIATELKSTNGMIHLSSLAIHQQNMLHLVMLEDERYLVATDSSGVKSVTLVPSWNVIDDEQNDKKSEAPNSEGSEVSPNTISISEVK